MEWQISLSKQARKFLKDLRDVRLRTRLEEAIDALALNPRPADAELIVLVVKIAHWREVYR